MTLQDRLMDDLKTAMRANGEVRRLVIRPVRAEVQNDEISKGQKLDDAGVVEVLSRMTRKYRESIELYKGHGRLGMMEREALELSVVMEYLPQQLSQEEVLEMARQAAQEVGAQGPQDKGKVMGKLIPQLRGKAEGSTVNTVVTDLLESLAR